MRKLLLCFAVGFYTACTTAYLPKAPNSEPYPGIEQSSVRLIIPGAGKASQCTGTLIPQGILTAAHCVEHMLSSRDIEVHYYDGVKGTAHLVKATKRETVKHKVTHQSLPGAVLEIEFNHSKEDIALLRERRFRSDLPRRRLAQRKPYNGDEVVAYCFPHGTSTLYKGYVQSPDAWNDYRHAKTLTMSEALEGGASGCALLNKNMEVVGTATGGDNKSSLFSTLAQVRKFLTNIK